MVKYGVKLVKVDVDEAKEVSEKMSIQAMPTVMMFHNGIEKESNPIQNKIQKLLDLMQKKLKQWLWQPLSFKALDIPKMQQQK